MERVTVSLDDALLAQFDDFIRRKGYTNRSEAVRDVLRDRLQEDRLAEDRAPFCVASLSYVYNHHERELARRIAEIHHRHHDLVRSTMHVHLDHDTCLEVTMLEGPTGAVKELADAISSETGVRHGQVNLVPVSADAQHQHQHGHGHGAGHDHGHGPGHEAGGDEAPVRPHAHTPGRS
ncbi:nickel-responsive transcriptional regulator NikR [Azospirillum sp. ST 5-10]|uniref:nickel-responsive transcriptional regulator NikR n=1 Tax=unclassified Azospirillum TaxID=2630922 RepID=UPI003F49E4FF